jgi:hypothetical protein
MIQQEVGKLPYAAFHGPASDADLPVCEEILFQNLVLNVPSD